MFTDGNFFIQASIKHSDEVFESTIINIIDIADKAFPSTLENGETKTVH